MRTYRYIITLIITLTLVGARASTSVRHFTESDGLPQSLITCVIQDSKGYIWISSWNGLSRYDGYSFSNFKARQGDNCPLVTNRILFIREVAGGDILCKCPDGYYLFKTAAKRFVSLKDKKTDSGDRFRPTPGQKAAVSSLPEYKGVETRILYKDRQGGYWIYTHHGLDRLTFGREKTAPRKCGNKGEEVIRAIFRDRQKRIFIADKNGFVRIVSPDGSRTGYLTRDGSISKTRTPFGASVYSIYQDSRGFIWMGAKPDGLFRLEKSKNGGFIVNTYTESRRPYSLNSNNIYDIKEDRFGRILVGTYGGGLNIIENPWSDSPRFVNCNNALYRYPDGAKSIHDMLLASDGTLLIATNSGVFASATTHSPRDMRFRQYKRIPSASESISSNQVMALLQAKDRTVYVATYGGGVNIIKKSDLHSESIRFTALTTENGMMSDVVLNMCEDGHGMIWLVSEHCLMKYNPMRHSFTNYSESLFAGSFSFSEVKPLCDRGSGTLLFGTTQGVLTLNEQMVRKSSFKPAIFFDAPACIDLRPEEKNLSIGFAALDLNKNEPIQYAYMLEGVDTRWMYTTENRINLSNIPAGTFRLKVRSTNGDGIWCDNTVGITIHRTPYFNERPVAWMLYGGLILLAAFLVFKLYRYIRRLENEINALRLSAGEKMEYIKVRVGDIISGSDGSTENAGSIETSVFKSRIEAFVAGHLSDTDLCVDTIAREMCMSRSALYVMMKKDMGCTPNSFILDMRLDAARRMLLEDKNLNVSEIAYRCGFSDPKYFSRCFKKATGMTPSEMRMA